MSKKEKSLHDKVKQFFGKREPTPNQFERHRVEPYNLSNDVLKEIGSESPLNNRLKVIKDLYEIVLTKKLDKYAVEAIVYNVKDLAGHITSIETRHIVLQFYTAIINGQREHMTLMRSYLFKFIVLHTISDDLSPRLELLKALSENGRNVSYFDEEIGSFLLQWFPDIRKSLHASEFLILVTNVIKFNAAYIDDHIIDGFVKNVLNCCVQTKCEADIQECLNVLEAILCYSHLPHEVLHPFICTLCHTVNIKKISSCSCKQMKNLLGTNVGHTGIYILCLILQDSQNYHQPLFVRGAVFFIAMALWGVNRVQTLIHPPTAVLPSFLKVLSSNDETVAYEVILSLQKLVVEEAEQLKIRTLCWNMIFDIVSKILDYPKLQQQTQPESLLVRTLHDFIDISEKNCPEMALEHLYKIIDQCSDVRNENSVIRLVNHIAEDIKPLYPDFLAKINKLLEKFFKNEKRSVIQLEVLRVVQKIRLSSLCYFEDDLMDQTILQNLSYCDTIPDVQVRSTVVQILIDLAESCSSSWFFEITDAIEKVMKRLFEKTCQNLTYTSESFHESFSDIVVAVKGFIKVFQKKFFTMPSNHCIEIYNILVNHIQSHYQKLRYFDELSKIRQMILQFFLKLRINQNNQIGIYSEGITEFSVYVLCDNSSRESTESVPSSPPPSSPSAVSQAFSFLNYSKAYQVIITSLKEERDWRVLEILLKELPSLLQNKALIIQAKCSISILCSTLHNLVNDGSNGLPGCLKNAPERLTRTDINTHIFPCVSALTSYHSLMESYVQRVLIRCLQSGLVSRSAKICMEGLTLCTLEMENSMIKLLPDVLLKLSKISSTVGIAISVLEFLSNLIRLPSLYVSFVEDQYMSIFAIALPYTNPFKFNQYTVALAHHVLSMWFLKCRIPFRRDFAKFISKGLLNNLKVPRDISQVTSQVDNTSAKNDDLSVKEISTDAIISLHTELMETGLDLMARFTFGMSSNVPKRSPVAEFLLENGQKSSWIIGHKIVTINTSGCGTKCFKDGLCEHCYSACHEAIPTEKLANKSNADSVVELNSKANKKSSSMERKRHHSAIHQRNTALTSELTSNINKTKDDILLHFQKKSQYSPRLPTIVPNTESNVTPPGTVEWNTENKQNEDKTGHLCSCWCTSWAEVHIRRPTGNTSFMMKIENQLFLPSSPPDVPLSVLTSLIFPQKEKVEDLDNISFADSECSNTVETEMNEPTCTGAIDIARQKTSPPVRRTNSSPDMNTGWSNFEVLKQEKEDEKHNEESVESDKEPNGYDDVIFSTLTSSTDHEFTEKQTKKSLRLNLPAKVHSESLSSAPAFKDENSDINSAPIGKFFAKEESVSQQPSSAHSHFRDRGYTMPVRSPSSKVLGNSSAVQPEASRRSGMSPSFVFLQLFHNSCFGPVTHKPLLLLKNEHNVRALNVLDHIPPYDTHKIGIVYIGPGQSEDEVAIFSNVYGSARYVSFLRGLGKLVLLNDIDPQTTYLGGLDTRGEDGKFTIVWHDDVMQVAFHVATLMLNKESDKNRNEKKKHIGNDSVVIVYNESGKDFNLSTIKGQVTYAYVIIKPDDFNSNIVSVKLKSEELTDTFGHSEQYIVSDASLSVFVRQMALHANLAALIISRRKQSGKYAQISNWLERLRTIKRLRSKVLDDINKENDPSGFDNISEFINFDDFTDYV